MRSNCTDVFVSSNSPPNPTLFCAVRLFLFDLDIQFIGCTTYLFYCGTAPYLTHAGCTLNTLLLTHTLLTPSYHSSLSFPLSHSLSLSLYLFPYTKIRPVPSPEFHKQS